jgi:hypothetical protein
MTDVSEERSALIFMVEAQYEIINEQPIADLHSQCCGKFIFSKDLSAEKLFSRLKANVWLCKVSWRFDFPLIHSGPL